MGGISMGILSSLIGSSIAEPIEAIGKVIGDLYESPGELLTKETLMKRVAMRPQIAQTEINKIEAAHRTVFVAGWRPFIGWVCGLGLAFEVIINPILTWATGRPVPHIPNMVFDLITILLGWQGALRTYEKIKGHTK